LLVDAFSRCALQVVQISPGCSQPAQDGAAASRRPPL